MSGIVRWKVSSDPVWLRAMLWILRVLLALVLVGNGIVWTLVATR